MRRARIDCTCVCGYCTGQVAGGHDKCPYGCGAKRKRVPASAYAAAGALVVLLGVLGANALLSSSWVPWWW